ncbi:hypothetical protein DM826_07295 [Halonotius aquaticus]|uniref:DNA-binding phage zinc finger domain-containing protein n=1 Tax=Halonotius aquaticus TaxID=2216978 RepID=A0A3A6Q7M2_9EURY|nr:hypothetical protein [Halonotius aquaticus]RJX43103.1 hypothetical protein DM826_07295 [Halonotius aquaticus]
MVEIVLEYECHVTGDNHAVPGPDVRIMRIGDGGFVVGCNCVEPLVDVDDEPHETVDHLVNIYANDPSPRQWLTLERAADGWYGTTMWESPEGFEGTNGSRRAEFRDRVADIVDEQDGRDLQPTEDELQARKIACPHCGATPGQKCERPSCHRIRKPHAERIEAAKMEGLIDCETATSTQTTVEKWA